MTAQGGAGRATRPCTGNEPSPQRSRHGAFLDGFRGMWHRRKIYENDHLLLLPPYGIIGVVLTCRGAVRGDKKSGRPSVEKRPRQRKVGANAKHLEPPAERRSGYPPPQVVRDYASRIVIFSPMAASRLIVKSKSAPSS